MGKSPGFAAIQIIAIISITNRITTERGRIYPIQSFAVPFGACLMACLARGNIMNSIAIKNNAEPILSQSIIVTAKKISPEYGAYLYLVYL
jgi:hypothetical protein